MLISYVMDSCPTEAGENYDPSLFGPCKANCVICSVSACPYNDPGHFGDDGCETCHRHCPIVMGLKYDASWEGPCHEGCRACSVYACPWAYEGHFDDLGCGECDYMAQFSDVEDIPESKRLEIIKTCYSP
jgi:hypothetical protein